MTRYAKVGIKNIAIGLPSMRISHEDMAAWSNIEPAILYDKTRVKQKPALALGEDLIALSTRTVEHLLHEEELNPLHIDFLIFATGTYILELNSPAAKIAASIGASDARCFDISHGCNAGNLAIELGRLLMQDDDISKVLIICADQTESLLDYSDKTLETAFSFADGTAAVLLERSESILNQLLGYDIITKTQYHHFASKEGEAKKLRIHADAAMRQALKQDYIDSTISIVERLLGEHQLNMHQIPHIFINQANPWLIEALINHYQLEPGQVHRTHELYGHMGTVDTLFGFKQRIERGQVKAGDYCLLLTSGYGFSWSGHLIQH